MIIEEIALQITRKICMYFYLYSVSNILGYSLKFTSF